MDRVTAGARSDHHWQMKAVKRLVKFATALVIVFFQLISRLGVYSTFPAWRPRRNSLLLVD